MTDDYVMRFNLQRVLAYRELCRSIRSSGRGNVFFAVLFFAFAYFVFQPNAGGAANILVLLYAGLALAEIGVGLFKWFFPNAEGVLLDALLLLLFAGINLGSQALVLAMGQNPSLVGVFIGLILLSGAVRRFKNYLDLRRAFADRPTSDQLAWFDDLIYEIKHADPATDDLALDLPTRPHWKAKLLGTTAFFVEKAGREVLVAGPWDFGILPAARDGSDPHRVRLHILDRSYKPFDIDDASWTNYRKWIATHQNEPAP